MLHILYTEEEGGDFHEYHYIAQNSDEKTRELFNDTVKSGRLLYSIGDRTINISPAYVCLVETVDDFDFVLGKTRLTPPEYKDPMAETGKALENAIEKPKEGENDQ